MSPRVRSFLAEHDAVFSVHNHAPLVSFEDARSILPHDPATMVKGLVFGNGHGGFAIVALRAADRADYKKIADALGLRRGDLRAAEPEAVMASLDMEIGGIVPLPINGAVVLIDEAVAALAQIACGSGRNTATLEISGPELLRIAGGEIGSYAKRS